MPLPVAGPWDYLSGGVGLTELNRVATETADLLISGNPGTVRFLIPPGYDPRQYVQDDAHRYYVAASPIIAAVWSGQLPYARLLAGLVVNTMVREQARYSGDPRQQPVHTLANDVGPRVTSALLNGGDPTGSLMAMQDGMKAWSGVANVLPGKTSTGWCRREFVLSDSLPPQMLAVCSMKLGADNVWQIVSAPKPAADAVLAPQTAALYAPQPPPTHAQVDAIVTQKMADEGQSLEHMESVQELQELAIYLGALAQARQWLTLGLHIPAGATDAQVWAALKARDIDPAEALDWFFGCDAGADCFRERMNRALGEAEERALSKRTKLMVGVGAAGAALVAILALRSRGGR
jgi:hypothetical protein